jgi:nicotinate-nucleotide adenylyltransferase
MRVGIYGGTFDPPHIGHINACEQFLNAFSMDKLFVIPACVPPHKELNSNSTVQNRFEMSQIAFSRISNKIEISDVEIKRKGKSFTSDTLSHFRSLGFDDILLLCGTDMYITLDEWYNPEYIFEVATIVCARRENETINDELIQQKTKLYIEKFNARVQMLDLKVIDISSSEIREQIKKNQDCEFLTAEVMQYIKAKKLYR